MSVRNDAGMDTFQRLRKQAVTKRDNAIKAARAEYRATMARITFLQRRLGGKDPEKPRRRTKHQPLNELIVAMLPRDRLFTIGEVTKLIQQAEPERNVREATVRAFFQEFNRQGTIRRVRRANQRVLWAVADYAAPLTEFAAKPLTVVAEHILRERGPMTATELVVEMQDRGHRSDADPRLLLDSVGAVLRRNPGRFTAKNGRWRIVWGKYASQSPEDQQPSG